MFTVFVICIAYSNINDVHNICIFSIFIIKVKIESNSIDLLLPLQLNNIKYMSDEHIDY